MLVGLAAVALLAAPASAALRLDGDEAEQAAQVALEKGDYVEAREKAEAILDVESKSFLATYVLAMVFFRAEGNYPRALFLLRQSKSWLEKEYGAKPEGEEATRWHKRLLNDEQWLLGKMDRREEQLEVLRHFDTLYTPSVDHMQIWPLLKLRRFDEAREIGKKRIFDDSAWVRERAYNGLIAIEDEAGNRQASYDWGKKAVQVSRGNSCILNSNTALAARRCFDLEAAERYDRDALKSEDQDCPTSPHHQLTTVYLNRGEYQKSLSALQALRKVPRTADQRVQSEMVIKARLVELMLALGQFDEAAKRAKQLLEAPDRAGMTSYSPEIVDLGNAVLYSAVLSAQLERTRERISVASGWKALDLFADARLIAVTRWETRRLALRLVADPDLLLKVARPYYTEVLPWYGGELFEVLGRGLMKKAIAAGREIDADFAGPAGAMYDALLGEMAWSTGDWAEATRLGDAALAALPKGEFMVARRIRSWLAESALRSGQSQAAYGHFHEVLEGAPVFLRMLGVRIPVTFTANGRAAEAVIDRLRDGPRFTDGDLGFTVDAATNGDQLQICLLGPGGYRYGCADETVDAADDDSVAAAAQAFYDKVLSPKVELTQSDVNSLDGAPTQLRADQAVKSILGEEFKK